MINDFKLTVEDQWRGIVLYGRNVASYKFALAKALLELRPEDGQLITLDELALPFALHVAEHLKSNDKQATSSSSRFLDACRAFNRSAGNASDRAKLTEQAVKLGFNNVIDAFHVVGSEATPSTFFIDERASSKGVRVTEHFSTLMTSSQAVNLLHEVESRWRLVETAWEMGVSRSLLGIAYDEQSERLFALDRSMRRRAVTSCRAALNGYQKGKCFYCFRDIAIDGVGETPDVDHFLPHALKQYGFPRSVDGIWNLVLACRDCNRGAGGKSDMVPSLRLLKRLHKRNEYLIRSQHPLRETLLYQLGATEGVRSGVLNELYMKARTILIHQWEPVEVAEPAF